MSYINEMVRQQLTNINDNQISDGFGLVSDLTKLFFKRQVSVQDIRNHATKIANSNWDEKEDLTFRTDTTLHNHRIHLSYNESTNKYTAYLLQNPEINIDITRIFNNNAIRLIEKGLILSHKTYYAHQMEFDEFKKTLKYGSIHMPHPTPYISNPYIQFTSINKTEIWIYIDFKKNTISLSG